MADNESYGTYTTDPYAPSGNFATIEGEPEEGTPPSPLSDYFWNLDTVTNAPGFFDKPWEEQLSAVREVYYGPDLNNPKKWEDEEEAEKSHIETVALLREANGKRVALQDYENVLPPRPDLTLAKDNDEAYALLDAWEEQTKKAGRVKYGVAWKEIEEPLEKQIEDYVDTTKRVIAAKNFYGPEVLEGKEATSRFQQTKEDLARFSMMFRRGASTLIGAFEDLPVIGESAKDLRRNVETAHATPEIAIAPFISLSVPLPPDLPEAVSEEARKKKGPILKTPYGDFYETDLLNAAASGAATIIPAAGLSKAAAVMGLAEKAATIFTLTPLMSLGARLSYQEAYDKVFQETQNPEKASTAGYLALPGGLLDGLGDAVIGLDILPTFFKTFGTKVMAKTLGKLSAQGALGKGLATGFGIFGTAVTEGGVEGVQEIITGKAAAYVTGDPSLKATPKDLILSTGIGFLMGGGVGAIHLTRGGGDGGGGMSADQFFAEYVKAGNIQPAEEADVKTITPEEEFKVTGDIVEEEVPISKEEVPVPEPTEIEEIPTEKEIEEEIKKEGPKPDETDSFISLKHAPTQEVPIEGVEDEAPDLGVEQFKEEFTPLEGPFETAGTGPIMIWIADVTGNGRKVVLTGRHRFELAKREGKETISAQIVKESDGWTPRMANLMDVKMNIRDAKGTEQDYAKFFRDKENRKIGDRDAKKAGFFKSVVGQRGYLIGKYGSDNLYTAHAGKKITSREAAAIAKAAPNDEKLQQIGIDYYNKLTEEGKATTPETLTGRIRVAQAVKQTQGDLFGKDAFVNEEQIFETVDQLRKEANALYNEKKLAKAGTSYQERLAKAIGPEFAELDLSVPENAKRVRDTLRDYIKQLQDPNKWGVNFAQELKELTKQRLAEEKGERQAKGKGEQVELIPPTKPKPVAPAEEAQSSLFEESTAPIPTTPEEIEKERVRHQEREAARRAEEKARVEAAVPGMVAKELPPEGSVAAGRIPKYPYKGQTVYRGYGRETLEEPYGGAGMAYPILGIGKYYSLSEKHAKVYGPKVSKRRVNLQNPFVIRDDQTWRALTKEANWEFPLPSIHEGEGKIKAQIDQLHDMLVRRGHDGVIIDFPDVPYDILGGGREIKLLRKVFGEAQVVHFPETEGKKLSRKELGGISPARQTQFQTSEVYEKLQEAQQRAIDEGMPELAPLSREAFNEFQSQEAGEYLSTTDAEQTFLAERFLKGKDQERLARDLIDPEIGNEELAQFPEITSSRIRGRIQVYLNEQEKLARERGETDRATDLTKLSTEFFITNYRHQRTGLGQALAIGRINNEELGIVGSDKVIALVEDIVNTGKNLDAETQKQMIELSAEADKIAVEEAKVGDQASQITTQANELERLRNDIETRRAEVQNRTKELQTLQDELAKEQKKLEAKDKRLQKSTEKRIANLEQQITEIQNRISAAEAALAKTQEQFARISKQLKSDINYYRKIERDLKNRKKQQYKKELKLRQKRAATRESLLFKTLPQKAQGEIKELAERYEKAGEGSFLRQELAGRMINRAIQHSGGASPLELANVIWYANALSGLSTQGINIYGSALQLLIKSLNFAARNPTTFPTYLSTLVKSALRKGTTEAANILESGRPGRTERGKYGLGLQALELLTPQSTLESLLTLDTDVGLTKRFENAFKSITGEHPLVEIFTGGGIGKIASRGLRAADAFWYRTAFDAMAGAKIAMDAKKMKNLTKEEIANQISESLYLSGTLGQEAMAQAETEVRETLGEEGTRRDIVRRAYEILDSQLPEQVFAEGDRWGSSTTYTDPVHGMFGALASVINNGLAKATLQTRWGPLRLGQPWFPFVNVVANVAEVGVETFPPTGFLKAAWVSDPQIKAEVRTNAILGSALAAIVLGIANAFKDDDDPAFAIYGSWNPLPKERKDQLRETGARPFTVKINDSYIPYNDTPLYWLAAFGAYYDNYRWNSKFNEHTSEKRIKMMLGGIGSVFFNQSTLKGLSELQGLLTGERSPTDVGASYLGVFLPGSGFTKDLDRIFNAEYQEIVPKPGAETPTRFLGAFFKNYPVVGENINRPLLNGFGEPVKPLFEERFGLLRRTIGTTRKENLDPEWQFLAERGLNFSGFRRDIEIGKGKGKGTQFMYARKKKERGELIGRAYTNIFTPEERYEYIQFAGPQIKRAINRIMETAGDKPREVLQGEIDKAVTKAKREAKIRFLARRLRFSL